MGSRNAATESLSAQLRTLRQRGCSVLVVADADATDPGCRRLLGRADRERRHVFLPTTVGVADVLARHGDDRDPARLGVVDAARARRGVTVETGASVDESAAWYTRVDRLRDTRALGEQAIRHLTRLAADDLEPATVRFCLESLDPFFDVLSADERIDLLDCLTGAVRQIRGLGHVHVSTAIPEASLVGLLPLFDATVRLRTDSGDVRQRWHIHETDYRTDWLPLSLR